MNLLIHFPIIQHQKILCNYFEFQLYCSNTLCILHQQIFSCKGHFHSNTKTAFVRRNLLNCASTLSSCVNVLCLKSVMEPLSLSYCQPVLINSFSRTNRRGRLKIFRTPTIFPLMIQLAELSALRRSVITFSEYFKRDDETI